MTEVNQVIQQVQEKLSRAGIDSPKAEAPMIVAHILEVERGKLGVMQALGEPIADSDLEAITKLADARATRIPLQHLTGEAWFYGLDLKAQPGVFIPRVETEVLIETTAQRFAEATGPLKILDLCTGTGAIAAALAAQLSKHQVATTTWAVDLSPEAVELAKHNTAPYNVTVVCADATDIDQVLAAEPALVEHRGSFDVVVSNPPYIPADRPVLQTEAKHDPALALYGGSADGSSIPLAIADQALHWLAPGGFFIMEYDQTHAQLIADQMKDHPEWRHVTIVQDLTHIDRFVSASRA